MFSRRGGFQSVGVLGVNAQSVRIAVRFASAGFRVCLYDRDLQAGTVDALLGRIVHHEPQLGFEVLSLIAECDYKDNLKNLAGHDLLIEAYAGSIQEKQAWLTRLAPYFSRDALVVSDCEGEGVQCLAEALPAGMRTRFLGARFTRTSNIHRLVEVVVPLRCEERQFVRFCDFLRDNLGLKPYVVPDEGNFVLMRVTVFVLGLAFFHGKRLGLSMAEVEALTARILGREHGGVCLIVGQLGHSALRRAFARVRDFDRAHFAAFFDFSKMLEDVSCFYDFTYSPPQFLRLRYRLPEVLNQVFLARDWRALCALEDKNAQFMVAFLRDVWQFLARVAFELDMRGEDLDGLLYYGMGWRERPWQCLQDFQPRLVYEYTKAMAEDLPYDVVDFWARKGRRRREVGALSEGLITEAVLLSQGEVGRLFLYQDMVLIWQNYVPVQECSLLWLQELLEACERARIEGRLLVIDYRAEVQSLMYSWHALFLQKEKFAEYLSLFYRLLLELRMLAQPVVFSATGRVYDVALAILMQCDVAVVDSDFSWQLASFAKGLTGIGGVWFEWLRRLPQISPIMIRQQLASVLDFVLSNHEVYGAQYARRLQILRAHDVYVANPSLRAMELKKLVDYCLLRKGGRAMRFPLSVLSEEDLAWQREVCSQSDNAWRYRRLLDLLLESQRGEVLSLRLFLKAERALFVEVLGDSD